MTAASASNDLRHVDTLGTRDFQRVDVDVAILVCGDQHFVASPALRHKWAGVLTPGTSYERVLPF